MDVLLIVSEDAYRLKKTSKLMNLLNQHLREFGTKGLPDKPEYRDLVGKDLPLEIIEYNKKSWPATYELEQILEKETKIELPVSGNFYVVQTQFEW